MWGASLARGETHERTTVEHSREHEMSNTSFISNVSLVRRYGTKTFSPAAAMEARVRARMQSFRAISERLTAFVSSMRFLSCPMESAARSEPARSMTIRTPARGASTSSMAKPGCATVRMPTPWERLLVALRSVGAVARRDLATSMSLSRAAAESTSCEERLRVRTRPSKASPICTSANFEASRQSWTEDPRTSRYEKRTARGAVPSDGKSSVTTRSIMADMVKVLPLPVCP